MDYLKFKAQCPLCNFQLDDIRLPGGLLSSGGTVCKQCKQQVAYYYSPSEQKLVVSMRTMPAGRVEPEPVKYSSYAIDKE